MQRPARRPGFTAAAPEGPAGRRSRRGPSSDPRASLPSSMSKTFPFAHLELRSNRPFLPSQICSEYVFIFFKGSLVIVNVFAGGLVSVVEGKDKAQDETLTLALAQSSEQVGFSQHSTRHAAHLSGAGTHARGRSGATHGVTGELCAASCHLA